MQAGLITSPFGPRGSAFHDGLDIAAEEGSAVYAAGDGRVIYSDQIPGMNIVIVSTTMADHGLRAQFAQRGA